MIEATCPNCGDTLSLDDKSMDGCECGDLVIGDNGSDWD